MLSSDNTCFKLIYPFDLYANSVDSDQMRHLAVFDIGLHILHSPIFRGVVRLLFLTVVRPSI